MKLKNMNRGIALGLVLAIGTGIYVAVENAQFKNSQSDIENVVNEYCAALVKSNVGNIKEKQNSWNDLVNNYFVDYNNEYDYSIHKSQLLSNISSFTSEFVTDDESFLSKDCVTSADYEVSDITIKKSGNTGATVTFSCSVYYEYSGVPLCLDFNGIGSLDNGYYENENNSDKSYKGTREYSGCSLLLMKEADGWKIASMSNNYGYMDNMQEDSTASVDLTDSVSQADVSSSPSESSTEEVSSLGE